jgi:hypothetical protein
MTKGLIEMKKLLSLVVLAGVIGLVVGCEDKKTSPPAGGGASKTSTPSPSTGTPAKS